MPHPKKTALLQRLRTASGHLKAVIRMVEEDAPCEHVLQQIHAVQAALQSAGCVLIEEQMAFSQTVIEQDPSPEVRLQALERLIHLYQLLVR